MKAGFMAKSRLINIIRNYAIIFVLLLLVVIVSIFEPKFLTLQNFKNILNQISVIGVVACGMTFVILIGCIDLSVGSLISVIGIIAIGGVTRFGDISGMLLALAAGALVGLVSGSIMAFINGRLGESFMITYGMQSVLAAMALIISGGLFMMVTTDGVFTMVGKNTFPVIVFIVLIALCQVILTMTKFGRKVLFLGANPKAAKLSGINVRLYTMLVFMLCGIITAVAGILLPSRVMSANPNAGIGYELDAIAACVVGGVSMKGGSGSFVNTLIGVITIGVLSNALNLLGITTYPQMMVKGFVIALAVTLDIVNKGSK